MLSEINDKDFEKIVLKSDLPVVVDFWAEWCRPCLQLAPTLEAVSKELEGQVKIVKINIDKNPENPGKYGIRSIPTLMLFNKGELTATQIGSVSKDALLKWINENKK